MTEIELIEQAALRVGMKSVLNHGAGSCVYSEGCDGVSQEHLIAFTREVALHCAVQLAGFAPAPAVSKAAPLTVAERAELDQLRLLAGGNACIPEVQRVLGPMSLWSAQALQDHIDREVAAVLASPQVAPHPAYLEARDAILHDRGPLEGEGLTSEQTNAVLAVLDDAFAPAPVAPQDDARDAARLDFLIEHEAFVVASYTRLDPTHKFQCWNNNDDPDERHLSGEHEYFDTAREAIDAAMSASTPAAKPTEPTLPTQGEQSHD